LELFRKGHDISVINVGKRGYSGMSDYPTKVIRNISLSHRFINYMVGKTWIGACIVKEKYHYSICPYYCRLKVTSHTSLPLIQHYLARHHQKSPFIYFHNSIHQ